MDELRSQFCGKRLPGAAPLHMVREDSPTDTIASLDESDSSTRFSQRPCGNQSGSSGAEYQNVVGGHMSGTW